METLHLDYETRSCCDLEVRGLDNYVHDPSTQVLLAAYAFGDRAVKLWQPHLAPMPEDLRDALESPFVTAYAWHVAFEREISKHVLGIDKPTCEWRDPMCSARYLSLPGSLDTAGEILGLTEDAAKLKVGKRLIKLFCEPEDAGGAVTLFGISEPTFRDWRTDPKDWALFGDYCKQDVVAERAALKKLEKFPLPEFEWETWCLDQEINSRGWPIGMDVVRGAQGIVLKELERLGKRLLELTKLDNPNSVNQVLPWLRERGYGFGSLDKTMVARALNGECDMTPEATEVLILRGQTSKSSVRKYTNIADMVSADGRLRHQYTFMGAARTGRWCLAEDTSVTVRSQEGVVLERPIQDVLMSDELWDGNEWVRHDGVVFSGDKEVIHWDGLDATPEHIVWTSASEKMPLGEAKIRNIKLWKGNQRYLIYKITSPSDKSYIGLTSTKLSVRWRQHCKKADTGINHPFYNAIRKYSPVFFSTNTLDFAVSKEDAQRLERLYISEAPDGSLYNLSSGGEADGAEGSRIFWERINNDPEAREEYFKKLSDAALSRGPEGFAHLNTAFQKWKVENPREAYTISRRNIRLSPSHRNPKKADGRPLIEKLRWKHHRSKAIGLAQQNRWDEMTGDRRKEIGEHISDGKKKEWKELPPEKQQEMLDRLKTMSASVDRSIQGPAASKGLKKFWEELRKDPIRYNAYIDQRKQTLKKTNEAKKCVPTTSSTLVPETDSWRTEELSPILRTG